MSNETVNAGAWTRAFADVLGDFSNLLPCVLQQPASYAEMSLAACRLRRLAALLPTAPLGGEFPSETTALINEGVTRLHTILEGIEAKSLLGEPVGFGDFDDLAFFEKARALPREHLISLYRHAITDPVALSPFERLSQSAALAEYGIALGDIGRGVVILFKIIAILILILACISQPLLIPFAIAAVKALADMDTAGEKDAKPPTPSTPVTPPAGGPQPSPQPPPPPGPDIQHYPDGDLIHYYPNGPTVWKPKNGPPQVIDPPPPPPPLVHGLSGKVGITNLWDFCHREKLIVAAGKTLRVTYQSSANPPGKGDAVIEVKQEGHPDSYLTRGQTGTYPGPASVDMHCGGEGGSAQMNISIS